MSKPKSKLAPAGHIYRCYVAHNWGTEKVLVTIKKRSVACASEEARLRAIRRGLTGVVVVDTIPMKYVAGRLVETRRMRRQSGKLVAARKPKARVSVRETRRMAMGVR